MNDLTQGLLIFKDELEKFQDVLIKETENKTKAFEDFQGEFERLLTSAADGINKQDIRKFARHHAANIENKQIMEDWKNIEKKLEVFKNAK